MPFALTVRLSDEVVHEVDIRAKKLYISRSEYIRKSIELMNKGMHQQEKKPSLFMLAKKLELKAWL